MSSAKSLGLLRIVLFLCLSVVFLVAGFDFSVRVGGVEMVVFWGDIKQCEKLEFVSNTWC